MDLIDFLAIIPAACAGYLVWQIRDVVHGQQTLEQVKKKPTTWIVLALFVLSLPIILLLINGETNAYR